MVNMIKIFLITFTIFIYGNAEDFSSIVNKKIDRQIDLSNQVVSVNLKITLENVGKNVVDKYYLQLDDKHLQHLSYLNVFIHGDKAKSKLEYTKSVNYLVINLNEFKVKPNEQSKLIEVDAKFTHLLELYPEEILQSERQYVVFNGNHYVQSPYLTRSQTTKVKLPTSGSIESFSKLKPSSQTDRTITYGPYENVNGIDSNSPMKIHYENNTPFLTVNNIERKIELSHWAGIISVEEKIDIKHTGAKLKGSFSRYEFQREPTNGLSSVKNFRTKLPATAQDIYYRDEIGNISTSNVRTGMQNTIVEIRPRFPLFGGWKTFYILGYYLPSTEYLSNDDNRYVLKVPFISHIYENSVIENALVKIILPEGSSNVKLRLPYEIKRHADEKLYTYLDTIGRPVIVLSKENLVESHIQNIEIEYTYNKLYMLQEPLLLVTGLFFLCLMVIIYVRLDFSLTKNSIKESAYKVTSIVERLLKHQDKRAIIYSAYDQAAIKFKASKDSNNYQSTLKKLNTDHKQESQAINDLLTKLKQEGSTSDVLEKVNELQRLDRLLKEQLQQQSTLVEKLVSNKINKQLYADTDNNITKKKEEIAEKMTSIVNSL